MTNDKLYAGAHAPFWHNGSSIRAKSYNLIVAALPAALMGIYLYGVPALRVLALATSSAMIWEWIMNRVMRRPSTIGDGNAAVISSYRLREECYGLPPNPELLKARLEKEAVHELGHCLGLVHCHDTRCVMQASARVEQVDLKGRDFCTRCRRALEAQ